jgi:hypothetical protein
MSFVSLAVDRGGAAGANKNPGMISIFEQKPFASKVERKWDL